MFAWRRCLAPVYCVRANDHRISPKSWSGWTGWSRKIAPLSEQVRALQAQLGTPAPAAAHSGAKELDIQQQRIEEQAQTKVEIVAEVPDPAGRHGAVQCVLELQAERRVGLPGGGGADRRGASRRHRAADHHRPGIRAGRRTIWGGKVHGSVYMDFFAGANNSALRVRTASIEIDWKNRSVMAGLEKPIFNPREPSSLAQVGISPLTGAGNLWLWLPQVRFEQDLRFSASHRGARADGRGADARDRSVRGDGRAGSGAPRGGRAVQFLPQAGRRPALGDSRADFTPARPTRAANRFLRTCSRWTGFSIRGSGWSSPAYSTPGQNVAHLGSGTRQGFAIYTAYWKTYGTALESRGGWGQRRCTWCRGWTIHLFTGQVDDANDDLGTGAIGKNLLFGGNAYFRLAPNVLMGVEASQVRTMYHRAGSAHQQPL